MKDLLRISDLSPEGLERVLSLAADAKHFPQRWNDELAGEAIVVYLSQPSTRTRRLFETAIGRLGGTPIVVGPRDLRFGEGDAVAGTARAVSAFARGFVARDADDDDLERFARAATVPVVNSGSRLHQPCQALADLTTLRGHFGQLTGLKVAYLGDGDGVAHSLMQACALAGVDVAVATPIGFEPDQEIVDTAERLAFENGSIAYTTHDPLLAAAGAHVVYANLWMPPGVHEDDRAIRASVFRPYQVTDAVMAEADPAAVFLHCSPSHRGQEVAADVIDGPRSLVAAQAENRLHVVVALLYGLVRREIAGDRDVARRVSA